MQTIELKDFEQEPGKLIDAAAHGDPFIILSDGEPLVTVASVAGATIPSRIGFLRGQVPIPDDFDTMGQKEMEELIYGEFQE